MQQSLFLLIREPHRLLLSLAEVVDRLAQQPHRSLALIQLRRGVVDVRVGLAQLLPEKFTFLAGRRRVIA